jgi:hypothetical protein
VMHQLDSVHVYSFKDCSGPWYFDTYSYSL